MANIATSLEIDSVLLPFVHTEDEHQARKHLDQLIAQAAPDIAMITRRSPAPDDAFQEAAQLVVKQLRDLRMDFTHNPIWSYSHYVRVIASRVVKGHFRSKSPERNGMVNSLRHLLRRDACLAVWDCDGSKLCGLARWRDETLHRTCSNRLIRLLDAPLTFRDAAPLQTDPAALSYKDLVFSLFNWLGHPIRFDELSKIVCGIKRIDVTGKRNLGQPLSDQAPRPDQGAEWRQFLTRLWRRIERLPRLQKVAYLLNFTAGDGELELFPLYGVASVGAIGAALQLDEHEFAAAWQTDSFSTEMRNRAAQCASYDDKFALLWRELPLPDRAIGHMLGITRQKVINLRKAASNRLAREIQGLTNIPSC